MTYILLDNTQKIWGIFSELIPLVNAYLNILELDNTKQLEIKEYMNNTNIVCKTFDKKEDICKLIGLKCSVEETLEETSTFPKDMKREIEKVREKYTIFHENLETFNRLLEDKVITLESPVEQIPELFQDKFEIYRDIVIKAVPKENAFSYFMDRYVPLDVC